MTYGSLEGLAGRVAAWLLGRGIAEGDRVAILADNDATWIAGYLGIRIGAVAVPLDTAHKTGQVRTVLEHAGARLLFTATSLPRHGTRRHRHCQRAARTRSAFRIGAWNC